MPKIFICYRRDDAAHQAGRILGRLSQQFSDSDLLKDVNSIPLGLDFRKVLSEKVAQCDVMLVLIGDDWLAAPASHERRLDDPADFVRIEIELALTRDIPVIPVLVGQASLPKPVDLPESIHGLCYRQSIAVRPEPDFHRDLELLISGIKEVIHARGLNLQAADAKQTTMQAPPRSRSVPRTPPQMEAASLQLGANALQPEDGSTLLNARALLIVCICLFVGFAGVLWFALDITGSIGRALLAAFLITLMPIALVCAVGTSDALQTIPTKRRWPAIGILFVIMACLVFIMEAVFEDWIFFMSSRTRPAAALRVALVLSIAGPWTAILAIRSAKWPRVLFLERVWQNLALFVVTCEITAPLAAAKNADLALGLFKLGIAILVFPLATGAIWFVMRRGLLGVFRPSPLSNGSVGRR